MQSARDKNKFKVCLFGKNKRKREGKKDKEIVFYFLLLSFSLRRKIINLSLIYTSLLFSLHLNRSIFYFFQRFTIGSLRPPSFLKTLLISAPRSSPPSVSPWILHPPRPLVRLFSSDARHRLIVFRSVHHQVLSPSFSLSLGALTWKGTVGRETRCWVLSVWPTPRGTSLYFKFSC